MSSTTRSIATCSLLGIALASAAAAQPAGGGAAQAVAGRFEQTAPDIGEQMPNLQIYDADGKEIWLHDALRGHHSVLILGCLT